MLLSGLIQLMSKARKFTSLWTTSFIVGFCDSVVMWHQAVSLSSNLQTSLLYVDSIQTVARVQLICFKVEHFWDFFRNWDGLLRPTAFMISLFILGTGKKTQNWGLYTQLMAIIIVKVFYMAGTAESLSVDHLYFHVTSIFCTELCYYVRKIYILT